MNFPAFLNTISTRAHTLPIVILYVTSGCNLKCVMCSYRDPLPNELTLDEIQKLAAELSRLGLRHIVYSGGEPLLRRDLPAICETFQSYGIKQSLLTNGLLLEKRFHELSSFFSEIIVSLDGPNAEIHNGIRGVEAFEQILKGIRSVLTQSSHPSVSIRTVVQKRNFREIGSMVELAKSLRVDRVSFLSADISSSAFHRDEVGNVASQSEIALNLSETAEFRKMMGEFVARYASEIQSGFISENANRLYHLVEYFEALGGGMPYPRNYCNAPMVSAVITSTGELLPCYFLPFVGNIRSSSIESLLNSDRMRKTRKDVRDYTLQRCHECVCTLHVGPQKAILNKF